MFAWPGIHSAMYHLGSLPTRPEKELAASRVRSAEMMLDSGLAAGGAAGDRTLDGVWSEHGVE